METHTFVLVMCAIGGLIITVLGVGVKWILKEIANEAINRDNSAKTIIGQQASMKGELKNVTDGHEKRLERIEEKVVEFRTGKSIDDALLHQKGNMLQFVEANRASLDRTGSIVDVLKDRVTRLETQHEQTTQIVGEIKSELKETRHEMQDRFDAAAKHQDARLDAMIKTQQTQFDQICASIREIRDTKPKA